jgi:hypothetical protein
LNERTGPYHRGIVLAIACVLVIAGVAVGVYFLMAPQSASIASQATLAPATGHAAFQLSPQNAGAPWSFSSTNGINRFEVRAGDHMIGDGAEPKERSEAYSSMKLVAGIPYRISFSMEIEPGALNTAGWLLLSQVQSTFDKGEAGHSPPLAFGLKGEHLQIESRSSPAKISTPAEINYMPLYSDPGALNRGHWYRFDINLKLDPFGEGTVVILRDGVQIVDYVGPIGFNDDVGAYFKEGIYRESASETTIAQFKDLSIRRVGS